MKIQSPQTNNKHMNQISILQQLPDGISPLISGNTNVKKCTLNIQLCNCINKNLKGNYLSF